MAASFLLSQHSSNPLELPTSDVVNKALLKKYQDAQAARDEDSVFSSDDPIAMKGEIGTYRVQRHRARDAPAPATVDLDEDSESDDELMAGMEDDDVRENRGGEEEQNSDEADGDADIEDSEEDSLSRKPPEERQEIEEEIADLEDAVPLLTPDYKILDRLGTGTFSSVYKAIDKGYHQKWDNTPWHGHHPASSSAHYQTVPRPEGSKVYVAVKRIYVTSNPERIRNEISIMEDCRGCRHVSQLITAFRHEDQVVAIMPYHRNEDFREFFRTLSMQGIKAYFRCMFRALRDIHARGMIHRDVKPANFLFDPRTGIGTLCDFGLACRIEPGPSHGACLHTSGTREYPHGRLRHRGEYDVEQIKRMQRESRAKSLWPSEKVGYPDKDTRPHSKANRAGTRGFRAPEVLLKCGDQTGAIDVWSAGMILLFFLAGKFPLFQSSDDIEALMEIATIIGRKKMEKTATLHSRTFATNVPSVLQDGMSWRIFVQKQNEQLMEPRVPDPRFYPYSTVSQSQSHIDIHLPPASSSSGNDRSSVDRSPSPSTPSLFPPTPEEHAEDIDAAFELLEGLMHPESTRRMTPRDALYHRFLADPDEAEDDEFFPHPFGEGVCGDWHHLDEVTEDMCVRVNIDMDGGGEIVRVAAGEGIAIGRWPCEFHRREYACEEE